MKKNKILGLVALFSTVLLVSACGNDSKGEAAGKEATDISSLPEAGDFSEKIPLHLSGSLTRGKVVDGNWVQERLEEQFNIDIENVKIDTWDSQQTSVMVASGDLPDVFAFTSGGMSPLDFHKQGLIRTIPREMLEKYAPNYSKMLDEVNNGLGWQMNKVEGTEEYASLTGLQSHTEGLLWAPTLRLDWMENLGLEIPDDLKAVGDSSNNGDRIFTTSTSYTIDELEEILLAFSKNDPDGNGKNDTYGMLPWNNNNNWSTTLFGAYGFATGMNFQEEGELIFPEISQPYKEAMLKLSDWYDQGIIDPEWTTMQEQTGWDKYKAGKVGYWIAQRAYIAQEPWTDGRAPQNILKADPNAKILVLEPETGPEGKQGIPAYTPVTLLGDSLQISKDVTDEQLARYLQLFDWMTYSEDAYWTKYGEPGEHSDWLGEEGDSALAVREEFPMEEEDMGFWSYNFRSYPGQHGIWLTYPKTRELMEEFFNKPEVVEKLAIRPYKSDLMNETDLRSLNERYREQLSTMSSEFFMKGIVGDIDIEKDWDNYVKTWRENGGDEIIAETDKAPLVSDLIEGKVE